MVVQRKQCPGYPPYTCYTLISPGSELCQFCTRTRDGDKRPPATPPPRLVQRLRPVFGQPAAMEPIVEIINVLESEIIGTCPCGGMAEATDHEMSLLHKRYVVSLNPPTVPEGRARWRRGR